MKMKLRQAILDKLSLTLNWWKSVIPQPRPQHNLCMWRQARSSNRCMLFGCQIRFQTMMTLRSFNDYLTHQTNWKFKPCHLSNFILMLYFHSIDSNRSLLFEDRWFFNLLFLCLGIVWFLEYHSGLLLLLRSFDFAKQLNQLDFYSDRAIIESALFMKFRYFVKKINRQRPLEMVVVENCLLGYEPFYFPFSFSSY